MNTESTTSALDPQAAKFVETIKTWTLDCVLSYLMGIGAVNSYGSHDLEIRLVKAEIGRRCGE